MSAPMDAGFYRAWAFHFAAVASDYESQARLAMSLARKSRGRDRSRWVAEARRLRRAARTLREYAMRDHAIAERAA